MPRAPSSKTDDAVARARKAMLEGVGAEVAASFPGITRLGGQIVAALYLSETSPRTMDQLAAELGRAKSNIFANLRGLEEAGIVFRQREPGARYDSYALCGKYPDVIIGAYLARLRSVVADKQALCARTLDILGDSQGPEADALRGRVTTLGTKYDRFAVVFNELLPTSEGPLDLEALLDALPTSVLKAVGTIARRTMGFFGRR